MQNILYTFRQGIGLWKQVKFRQMTSTLFLSLFISPVIFFLGILLLWVISKFNFSHHDNITILEFMVSNPLILLLIIGLLLIGLNFLLILTASIQKIAHNYVERSSTQLKEIFRFVLSKQISLYLVGVATIFAVVIPMQLLIMVLIPVKALTPSIVGNNNSIDLDLFWDIFEAIVFSFIISILAGPSLLSISTIIIDDTSLNAFIRGWKLFLKSPVSTLSTMIIIWINFLSFFMFGRFILPYLLEILISDEIVQVIIFVLIILILLLLILFVFGPMFFTVMYNLYRSKYQSFLISSERE